MWYLEKYQKIPSRERFNFSRLEKISREKNRLEKYDKKNWQRKELKLRSPLEVGEKVLILADTCYIDHRKGTNFE